MPNFPLNAALNRSASCRGREGEGGFPTVLLSGLESGSLFQVAVVLKREPVSPDIPIPFLSLPSTTDQCCSETAERSCSLLTRRADGVEKYQYLRQNVNFFLLILALCSAELCSESGPAA